MRARLAMQFADNLRGKGLDAQWLIMGGMNRCGVLVRGIPSGVHPDTLMVTKEEVLDFWEGRFGYRPIMVGLS